MVLEYYSTRDTRYRIAFTLSPSVSFAVRPQMISYTICLFAVRQRVPSDKSRSFAVRHVDKKKQGLFLAFRQRLKSAKQNIFAARVRIPGGKGQNFASKRPATSVITDTHRALQHLYFLPRELLDDRVWRGGSRG